MHARFFVWTRMILVTVVGLGIFASNSHAETAEPAQAVVNQLVSDGAALLFLEGGRALLAEKGSATAWRWAEANSSFMMGVLEVSIQLESPQRLALTGRKRADGGLGLMQTERDVPMGRFDIVQSGKAVQVRWTTIDNGIDLESVPPLPIVDVNGVTRAVLVVDPDTVLTPQSIVFVLDASGSMAGERLAAAKEALRVSTLRLHSQTEVALVVFYACGNIRREVSFGASIKELNLAVSKVEASGSTPLGDALEESYDYLHTNAANPPDSRRIVVLSDGQETCGKHAADVIGGWDADLRAQQGFDIIGIDLGDDDNRALAELARLAGGTIETSDAEHVVEQTERTIRKR